MGADWPSGSGPAVAVVDDDQRIRAALRRALQLEGYEVLEGSDGHSPIRTVRGVGYVLRNP